MPDNFFEYEPINTIAARDTIEDVERQFEIELERIRQRTAAGVINNDYQLGSGLEYWHWAPVENKYIKISGGYMGGPQDKEMIDIQNAEYNRFSKCVAYASKDRGNKFYGNSLSYRSSSRLICKEIQSIMPRLYELFNKALRTSLYKYNDNDYYLHCDSNDLPDNRYQLFFRRNDCTKFNRSNMDVFDWIGIRRDGTSQIVFAKRMKNGRIRVILSHLKTKVSCIICKEERCRVSQGEIPFDSNSKEYLDFLNRYYICRKCRKNPSNKVEYICKNCGVHIFPKKKASKEQRELKLCKRCNDRNKSICKKCEKIFSTEHYELYCTECSTKPATCLRCRRIFASIDEVLGYCPGCNPVRTLKSHDFRESRFPFRKSKSETTNTKARVKNLFLGIELEVECVEFHKELVISAGHLGEFLKKKKIGLLKRDGSISSGFEIVLFPFTLKWAKENKEFFNPIFAIKKYGFRSSDTSTCGMHVHLSRNSFTSIGHVYRFHKFINSNPDLIYRVSQRSSKASMNRWARIANLNRANKRIFLSEKGVFHIHRNNDDENVVLDQRRRRVDRSFRYSAINLTNENTVEVRIFKGTLNPSSFMKNLEFCRAVYDFTIYRPFNQLTEDEFISFVDKNSKEFTYLHNFLHSKDKLIKKEEKGN